MPRRLLPLTVLIITLVALLAPHAAAGKADDAKKKLKAAIEFLKNLAAKTKGSFKGIKTRD